MPDVVITGLGIVSPYGVGHQVFWEGLLAGESALGELSRFETPYPFRRGGEVRGFDAATHLGAKGLRSVDRVTRLTLVAVQEALRHAGLELSDCLKDELGLVLGSAFCGFESIMGFFHERLSEGPNFVTGSTFGNTVMNAPASQAAVRFGMNRLNATVTTGFASGLDALGYAVEMLQQGRASILLAGGAEELCLGTHSLFAGTGRLADHASPFDPQGTGFIPSEGAAFLVLESEDHARSRHARILARLSGYGAAFDPGAGSGHALERGPAIRAIRSALQTAELDPAGVGLALTGANGTAVDHVEAAALREVFGPVPALAPKQLLGEAMGAWGALAAALATLILSERRVPLFASQVAAAGLLAPDGAVPGAILVEAFGESGHCAAAILTAERPGGDAPEGAGTWT